MTQLHGDHGRKNLSVLAVDPGETTGFALQHGTHLAHGQQPVAEFMKEVFLTMIEHDGRRQYDVIAVELFKVRPKITPSYITMETIGALRYLAEWQGVEFHGYLTSQTKRVSDERLKNEGLWTETMKHANDAARVLYLYRCGV